MKDVKTTLNLGKAWEITKGENVRIGIIDTGIAEHPFFANRDIPLMDFTGEGAFDGNGHGTHVAGIAAGEDPIYSGVAPKADIFAYKVLNSGGLGYTSWILAGIEQAIRDQCDVINLSLGAEISDTSGNDPLSMAVDNAVNKGVVVCVAIGNSGAYRLLVPGVAKKGAAVGAVDKSKDLASFSSFGTTTDGRNKPDLMGVGVKVTSANAKGGVVAYNGTSMAAPCITGAVALVISLFKKYNKLYTPADIKNYIYSNCDKINDTDIVQGHGLLNVGKLIEKVNEDLNPKDEPNDPDNPQDPKAPEKISFWDFLKRYWIGLLVFLVVYSAILLYLADQLAWRKFFGR